MAQLLRGSRAGHGNRVFAAWKARALRLSCASESRLQGFTPAGAHLYSRADFLNSVSVPSFLSLTAHLPDFNLIFSQFRSTPKGSPATSYHSNRILLLSKLSASLDLTPQTPCSLALSISDGMGMERTVNRHGLANNSDQAASTRWLCSAQPALKSLHHQRERIVPSLEAFPHHP